MKILENNKKGVQSKELGEILLFHPLPRMSGNCKLHSTETALLYVTDDLFLAMDNKKVPVVVLLDISKAFYSISHVLLPKLQALGVFSQSLDCGFIAFLRTAVNGFASMTLFLTCFR